MTQEALRQAKQSFGIEAQAIGDTVGAMDWEQFARAVALLAAAPRVATSGCGHTGIACMHFAHSLCCIECAARFLSPAEAVHGGSGFLKKGDVLVVASWGGKTAELLPILEIARRKGAHILAVTENRSSPMAQRSNVVLPMRIHRESDKYNAQGTASFVALCAVFDALQTALIEEMGYQKEQFAIIHPGGAVGERLNPKI